MLLPTRSRARGGRRWGRGESKAKPRRGPARPKPARKKEAARQTIGGSPGTTTTRGAMRQRARATGTHTRDLTLAVPRRPPPKRGGAPKRLPRLAPSSLETVLRETLLSIASGPSFPSRETRRKPSHGAGRTDGLCLTLSTLSPTPLPLARSGRLPSCRLCYAITMASLVCSSPL